MGKGGTTIVSFFLGAVVGAAIALLYAPKSGEELRSQIKTETERALAEVQAQADKTRTELMSYVEQLQAAKETSEPVQVEADVENVAMEAEESV